MLGKVKQLILDQDIYSPTVSVYFRGEDRYQSKRGALISLVCQILVIVQFIEPLTLFITKDSPTISSYKLISQPEGTFKIGDSQQVVAVQLDFGDENLADLDPTYGSLAAYSFSRNSRKYLPAVKCDYDKHFAQANLSEKQAEIFKSSAQRYTCFEGID